MPFCSCRLKCYTSPLHPQHASVHAMCLTGLAHGRTTCTTAWCLCRSPHLWKDPDTFRPERFSETNSNAAFEGRWAGYRPEAQGSSLYPNEVAADFAFVPFGGGARKCVGDQFALLEATVALAMLLRSASLPAFLPLLLKHSQGTEQ